MTLANYKVTACINLVFFKLLLQTTSSLIFSVCKLQFYFRQFCFKAETQTSALALVLTFRLYRSGLEASTRALTYIFASEQNWQK